ncbi:TetR/AcrR family transcriptional regulator [Paenibacillus soyae]|uniref:TetR/AcrR family transcriptional regulator n=1 Tax=Paenibacillus soyae TaxID=2969249 RepID=A0A9X2MQK0_9BACL|nr:TetR/AcrR family transcriptional regulator [Paenibacillus soyae]MCR2804033.1 TetR/AcrR family transcriptional regulator [Paenibacillus soyae]
MPKIIVTEEQWIELGMELFAAGGAEALVIESMAQKLACSKSSFYWYFSNRQAFIRRIVERWRERTTHQVIAASEQPIRAEEKVAALLMQMFSVTRKGDFLFYLRKLAGVDPAYREKLDEVEQARMDYARSLFMQLGMDNEEAGGKAWLLYHYYLGWYERHKLLLVTDEDVQHHMESIRKRLNLS